jgi:hypothetical protein
MSEDKERRRESVNGRRIIENYEPNASVERCDSTREGYTCRLPRRVLLYVDSDLQSDSHINSHSIPTWLA